MITFQAKYLSPVNIGKINDKKNIVPYKAAIVELNPNDIKDSFSLNLVSYFSLKKKRFADSIFEDFLDTTDGKVNNRNWVKYIALTKEQDSYKYIKSRNILGLAEISSAPLFKDCIYLDYLQTVKKRFFNKYCFVGRETLEFLKKMYPDMDIVLRSLTSAVKFYKNNGFYVAEEGKKDGLIKMRYHHINI